MDRQNLDYAKQLPLLFAQVREDPRVDLKIIHALETAEPKVLMIGSGGCTLAPLAHQNEKLSSIDVVDSNKSQLHLCQLKLFLMTQSKHFRAQVLGHEPMNDRLKILKEICAKLNIPISSFGDEKNLDFFGPDYLGRYEWLFKSFSETFKYTEFAKKLSKSKSVEEQRKLLNEDLTELRALFESHFALDLLIELFGEGAVQNKRTSYANHFYERFLWTLEYQNIHDNPFFYQFAFWTYSKNTQSVYLSLSSSKVGKVTFYHQSMLEYLESAPEASYDYIHLSNILDWLDTSAINRVLNQVERALKPKGKCSIRQLNSLVKIDDFKELSFESLEHCDLAEADWSFFYPKIYIGAKL